MKTTRTQTLRTEEIAKRVEEELIFMGRRVKRSGRSVTEYLLPRPKGKEDHDRTKHVSKRERTYGWTRKEEEE